MRVLVLDNYDSFAYNLVQYLGELGARVDTVRNDRATVDELLAGGYERCVVSPGPCTPQQAGISVELARRMGHQALAEAFGGHVSLHEPIHGKATTIEHDGRTIFRGMPSPLTVGRYHSLVVDPDLPACLEQTARGDGVVMGVRHRELPAEGVQFHPESVLTDAGRQLLANFLDGP
jgi:anthranilate synthase/aminodeoxychorismate synthase-like glutamine amidotransferase